MPAALVGVTPPDRSLTRTRPTILEPVMNVEVYAPSDFAGDLMGDLNGRRGRISGMDTRFGWSDIFSRPT